MEKTETSEVKTPAATYVLSLDLGSGGPKAGVVSITGEVRSSATERVQTFLLPGGGAEQDPAEWWNKSLKVAREAISRSGVAPEDIIAIACDSQFFVTVPLNEHGEPLMKALHWLDSRGGPYNRAIIKGFPSVMGYGIGKLIKWVRQTGLAPTRSGIDSLGHVLFIKNEHPEIYRKTRAFLEPMDFLTFKLTGNITGTQHTMMSMLVSDNRKWGHMEYSKALLKLAGIDRDKLPPLVQNDDIIGSLLPDVAQELGLAPGTPVLAGMNDTNCSAIGSGAVLDFEGVIYIGTSLVMTCHVPFKKTDIFHAMVSIPSPLRNKYLLLAEQGTGGKSLEFILRNIIYCSGALGTGPPPSDAYDRLNRLAADIPPGSDRVLYLPWLNGSITPEENETVRGGFLNLSLSTEIGHLVRSIMEGLAYNSRWTRGPAEKFIGKKFKSFRFAGGGALSDVWAQIHADVLGVPVHQVGDPTNTTIRGAALAAFLNMGHLKLEQIPDMVSIKKTYEPIGANRDIYDRMFTQFREAYRRNKKIFAALNS